MATYHVNPQTMEPGACRAKTPEDCLFKGDSPEAHVPHFDTMAEARAHSSGVLEEKARAEGTMFSRMSRDQDRNRVLADNMLSIHTQAALLEENPPTDREAIVQSRRGLEFSRNYVANKLMKATEALASSGLDPRERRRYLQALEPQRQAVKKADATIAKLNTLEWDSSDDAQLYRTEGGWHMPDNGDGVSDVPGRATFDSDGWVTHYKAPADPRENIRAMVMSEPIVRSGYGFDENGNSLPRNPRVVVDEVQALGAPGREPTVFRRIGEGTFRAIGTPDNIRVQVGRNLSPEQAEQLAGLVGYSYAKTGGERGNSFTQDSPNSIVFHADTTKGRAYRKLDEFLADTKAVVSEGTPVRTTDQAGAGTKGTRKAEGLSDFGYVEFYTDDWELDEGQVARALPKS